MHEIVKGDILKYKVKINKGYKNPICIDQCVLYPTKSYKDPECYWVNIDLYDDHNIFYMYMLKKFGIDRIVTNMYLKSIKRKLK